MSRISNLFHCSATHWFVRDISLTRSYCPWEGREQPQSADGHHFLLLLNCRITPAELLTSQSQGHPVEKIPGGHRQVCPQMLPEPHRPPAAEEAYSPPSLAGISQVQLGQPSRPWDQSTRWITTAAKKQGYVHAVFILQHYNNSHTAVYRSSSSFCCISSQLWFLHCLTCWTKEKKSDMWQ